MKVVKPHIIKPRDDVLVIQELLSKVMEPIFDPLQKMGLFYPSEKVIALHPFRPMGILRDRNPLASKHYTQLTQLSSLARAVLYLLTGSIKSCRDYCEEIMQKELTEKAAGKARKTMLIDNPNFKRLMEKFEEFEKTGSTPHPKMEKLKDILINYFGTKMPDAVEGEPDKSDDTRVMVFSSYRAVVEEIIGELNQHRPLIRAAAFVGQATAKNGTKGLKQREQIELIERFQKGEFNVLVATSIGEEGLDIGEIDCTICYDTDKAPTRMIQRFGRTGRKRAGEVHALLAEAREEFNLDKAKGTYKEVQKVIDRGELYELYGDVPRLIPEHVKPSCIEKVMEITPYVREDLRKARSKGASTGGTKRKRNTDPNRNIPPDMPTSFTPASSVWSTFKKPKVAPLPEDPRELEELGTDDDLDRQIEAGSIFTRRTQSDKPPATKKKASSPAAKLRRSGTTAAAKKQAAKEKEIVKKYAKKSLAELEKEGEDDELDMQFESGSIFGSFQPVSKLASLASSSKRRLTPDPPMKTYEITDTEEEEFGNGGEATDDGEEPKSPSPARYDRKFGGEDMAWLVEDDEDIGVEAGSPEPIRVPSPKFERLQFEGDDSIEISQAYPARPKQKQKATLKRTPPSSPGIEIVKGGPSKPSVSFQPASKVSFAPEPDASTSRAQKRKTDMLPPPVPFNRTPLSSPSWEAPEPTFPVSKPKRRRVTAVASSDDDEPLAPLPPSQHRLHRRNLESTPAKPKPRPKKKEPKPHRTKPSLLDKNLVGLVGEAAHSGDEVSEGYSEEEEERSSDREFLKDSPSMTQISPSYEQTQMYRQSLFTQAPVGDKAPAFQRGPLRAKPFGRIDPSTTTRKFLPSSSPPLEDDELDSYEHGSFVVADEGDISLEINSDDAVLDW
ncbi:hypothetical protein D9611_003240 [Ephemerocybe angulata]|uniref:ATP-dependent DNA helicase n=1 Tax=Ephemerocybe angulata TaxID=980116 RepID=A0A8H5FHR0_9AGAR|nr:hypothetical protein D9611_003240 [Tulosesus angulatus]